MSPNITKNGKKMTSTNPNTTCIYIEYRSAMMVFGMKLIIWGSAFVVKNHVVVKGRWESNKEFIFQNGISNKSINQQQFAYTTMDLQFL